MSRFHWTHFTKPTFSRLKKKSLAVCSELVCGWNPSQAGWHLDCSHEMCSDSLRGGSRYAWITVFVLPICWGTAWGALKIQKERGLNLSPGSFHQEREPRALFRLRLLQAARSMGRRGLGQEIRAWALWQEAASPNRSWCPASLLRGVFVARCGEAALPA